MYGLNPLWADVLQPFSEMHLKHMNNRHEHIDCNSAPSLLRSSENVVTNASNAGCLRERRSMWRRAWSSENPPISRHAASTTCSGTIFEAESSMFMIVFHCRWNLRSTPPKAIGKKAIHAKRRNFVTSAIFEECQDHIVVGKSNRQMSRPRMSRLCKTTFLCHTSPNGWGRLKLSYVSMKRNFKPVR